MSRETRKAERAEDALYRCQGDVASEEWVRWSVDDRSIFNGQFGDFVTRRDGSRAIVRLQPHAALGNYAGALHGGAVMTFIDLAMFLGMSILGHWSSAAFGMTVDCNVQFVGAADLERPVDAAVELTRETGQFLFVRGTVDQAGDIVAAFMGMLRKPRR